jgi:hypothetical protein
VGNLRLIGRRFVDQLLLVGRCYSILVRNVRLINGLILGHPRGRPRGGCPGRTTLWATLCMYFGVHVMHG